jgi:hypothetical protein
MIAIFQSAVHFAIACRRKLEEYFFRNFKKCALVGLAGVRLTP